MKKSQLQSKQGLLTKVVIMMLLLLPSVGTLEISARTDVMVKKTYSKKYSGVRGKTLSLNNIYGNISVAHWNKNEVDIVVTVKAEASTERQARAKLNTISVDFESMSSEISARTNISSERVRDVNFSIDYEVKLPANIKCEIAQKYGNVVMVGEHSGDCEFKVQYGNVKADSFIGDLSIDIRYGNIDINNVKNAEIDAQYADNMELENAERLDVDAKYSNLELVNVNNLELESEYGKLDARVIKNATIEMKYGKCRIGRMINSLLVDEFDYSEMKIKNLDKNFKTVDIDSRYGNVEIELDEKASFKVNAKNFKYGKCSVRGFDVQRTNQSNRRGFDSGEGENGYALKVNGGRGGLITFDGNNYSKLLVEVAE